MSVNKSAPSTSSTGQSLRNASSDCQLTHGRRHIMDGVMGKSADPTDRCVPTHSIIGINNQQLVSLSRVRTPGEHDSCIGGSEAKLDARTTISNTENHNTESSSTRSTRHAETGSGGSGGTNDNEYDASFQVGDTSSPNPASRLPALGFPNDESPRLIATCSRHAMTANGHAVPIDRDNNFQYCGDELIYIPGAVQAFGVLVVIKEASEGRFAVCIASENSARLLGYTPQQLFRQDSFLDILSDEQADNILDHIYFTRDKNGDAATDGPDVFSVSIRSTAAERNTKLWCAMHITPEHPDLIICEFELEDDREYPLQPPEMPTPSVSEDNLCHEHAVEECNKSSQVNSRTLRIPRNTRRKQNEVSAMQIIDIMSQVQERLAAAPNLETFLNVLVTIVKELTGFHRVIVYQFDNAFNGKVVAELANPDEARDLYMGLQFPTTNFPEQARKLYQVNKVQLLYDRDLEPARLVCCTTQDLEQPLDLTHSYLRVMTSTDVRYPANMAIRASASIYINIFNQPWGLISCHAYGAWGMRVTFPVRKLCRLISDTASRNVERLSYISGLQARNYIHTVPTEKNSLRHVSLPGDLLALFVADFGILTIDSKSRALGEIEQPHETSALLKYFHLRKHTSVVKIQDIERELPDLNYSPSFFIIAGVLYIPLNAGGEDFVILFRKSKVRDIKWAGNPYAKTKEGTICEFDPRESFEVWHETVIDECREWSDEQVQMAVLLSLVCCK